MRSAVSFFKSPFPLAMNPPSDMPELILPPPHRPWMGNGAHEIKIKRLESAVQANTEAIHQLQSQYNELKRAHLELLYSLRNILKSVPIGATPAWEVLQLATRVPSD